MTEYFILEDTLRYIIEQVKRLTNTTSEFTIAEAIELLSQKQGTLTVN